MNAVLVKVGNLLMLFMFLTIPATAQIQSCQFDPNYKITIGKPADTFRIILEKMKTPKKEVETIISKFFTDDKGRVESLDDYGADSFDILPPNGTVKFRILSVQIGSAWDHLYVVFEKSNNGWSFLKALPISQIRDETAVKFFDYQNHHFLVLMDVQDHGFPWFAIADYDVFLMDKGMEEAGKFISYGDQDTSVLGRMSYEINNFSSPTVKGCPLELDLKIDFNASWGTEMANFPDKYQFDEFKAFSKKVELFYFWDEATKKFVFNSKLSDFKTDPLNVDLIRLDEGQFLNFFYPECEAIAREKDKNKYIWLMSILDNVNANNSTASRLKVKVLNLMK